MSSHSACLLCGKIQNTTKLSQISSSSSSELSTGDDRAKSLCKLLCFTPEDTEPWIPIFGHKSYCSNCLKTVEDVNSSLKQLETLEKKLGELKGIVKKSLVTQFGRNLTTDMSSISDTFQKNRSVILRAIIEDLISEPGTDESVTIKEEFDEDDICSEFVDEGLLGIIDDSTSDYANCSDDGDCNFELARARKRRIYEKNDTCRGSGIIPNLESGSLLKSGGASPELSKRPHKKPGSSRNKRDNILRDPDELACEYCNGTHSSYNTKMECKVRHRDPESVTCSGCGITYAKRNNLYRHIRSKHPDQQIQSRPSGRPKVSKDTV